LLPGAEHIVLYLWQEWIRNGRIPEAVWNGNRRVLRLTLRYRASVAFMFLLMSWLAYVLVDAIADNPNEPALLVLLAAAGVIWVLAAGGSAFALLERITFDHATLVRRSLFGAQHIRWDDLDSFRLVGKRNLMFVGGSGNELRVSSSLDGLGTLLAELERRMGYLPHAVAERLAVEACTSKKAPLISR
jgi:hypothetical protein